jgi:hypothetical protein
MVNGWSDLATWRGSTGQVLVPESGWQQLIAWLVADVVSPELVATGPQPEGGLVLEFRTVAGKTTEWHREFTEKDRAEVAEANNEYLFDAGVPPVPPGAAVYLTLPAGVTSMDEFCAELNEELADCNLVHPREQAAALREVLPHWYA